MSSVPGELQLWSGETVSLPARLPAARSVPGVNCGNPAQGRHSYSGSVSGQAGSLPTAHPPVTGKVDVPVKLFSSDFKEAKRF